MFDRVQAVCLNLYVACVAPTLLGFGHRVGACRAYSSCKLNTSQKRAEVTTIRGGIYVGCDMTTLQFVLRKLKVVILG